MRDGYLRPLFFLITIILLSSPSLSSSYEGPLQTKNQFPLFMHLNPISIEAARLENSYAISLSHSSVYLLHNNSEWSMGLDMELTELEIRARKIFMESLELGIDVPFLNFNSGFMDGPVNAFHKAFGFSDYGRNKRPENAFLYEVKRRGVTIIKGEDGRFGLSDITLSVKKAIIRSDPDISLKFDLELPTGDAKRGYGSGNFGADGSLLLDKRLGESFMSYCNIGYAVPGDLEGYETIGMRPFIFGGIALETAAWRNISLLTQLTFQESPYPKTGIRGIDAYAVLFAFGGRYSTKGSGSYEFSFTEDTNTAGAPDFTVGLAYKKSY